jgi:ethanolamine utilization protein EutA
VGESLLSVGIDIGTTTTQIVFSRIGVENTAFSTAVPRIKITGKDIIYRGGIYFTPLIDRVTVDTDGVREIVGAEYVKAGIAAGDVAAGAVIITGETARKQNSEAALRSLSGFAGDFVVAAAGSDLESVLAGRGAGTADLSKALPDKPIVNIDVGGGTSNIAVFRNGEPADTSCLDIGGRQIIIDADSRTVKYIADKTRALAERMGLGICEGKAADTAELEALCKHLAEIIAEAVFLAPKSADLGLFVTAHPLRFNLEPHGITYSGGVADFVYGGGEDGGTFRYGDIGVLLGRAIRDCPALNRVERMLPKETVRATVVGAGSNAVNISGSTVAWNCAELLPIKNIPIVKGTSADTSVGASFAARLSEKIRWFADGGGGFQRIAVGFRGESNPSFDSLVRLSEQIIEGMTDYLRTGAPLIVIIENDMAKSLGNLLMNALPGTKVIALDGISVENGDYIDIGVPVSEGRVIPVVVKTLVFGK